MNKKKNNINISIYFIFFIIILVLSKDIKAIIFYSFAVFMHELAHYFVAKKLGYNLNKFYLMPYGVCLNYQENIFSGNDEILIALAGPFFNLLLCIVCLALWWLFPQLYYFLDYFCFANLILGGFNLLPCFPLDGGRVFVNLLSKKIDREKAYKIANSLNIIFSLILVILFLVSIFKEINFTYLLIAIFLFSGLINPNKFSNYKFYSLSVNRKLIYKKGCGVKIFAVSSGMSLFKIMSKFSKYKYNVVYVVFDNGAVKVLSENVIQNLAIRYSPAYNIDEIVSFSKI